MEYKEYKNIYERLNTIDDICKLTEEGYSEEMLLVVLTQKINRDTKKRFHIVKKNAGRLLRDWKRGKSLMELSAEWKFPPILTAMLIFLEDGASKKEFWSYIREPELLCNETVADEVRDVVRCDVVYSPEANERHRLRGIWGETLLQDWLNAQCIPYRTECEIRNTHEKTPDCLLDEPMMFGDRKIYWIESKASFGDNTEFRYNFKKQLIPYTKLFGPGIVVYWMGKLNDLEAPDDIYVSDISILDCKLTKIE